MHIGFKEGAQDVGFEFLFIFSKKMWGFDLSASFCFPILSVERNFVKIGVQENLTAAKFFFCLTTLVNERIRLE